MQVGGEFLQMLFSFSATGGAGAYAWSNVQTGSDLFNATFQNGMSYSGVMPINESLSFFPSNPSGQFANIGDAPAVLNPTVDNRLINLAVVVWDPNLVASVSSGNQSVSCPQERWQVVEVWQSGVPDVLSAGLVP
jgi:hypothetical protein